MTHRTLMPLAALLLALTACGGDAATDADSPPAEADAAAPTPADDPAEPTTAEPPAEATSADATGAEAPTGSEAAGETVEVTGVDYAFEGLDPELAVGTELTLTNASQEEVHELVAFRTDSDAPLEELLASEEEPPGEFVGVLVAPPGAEGFAPEGPVVLDQPGRYVFVCFIPTGADPQAYLDAAQSGDGPPEVEGGPPHFVQGMVAEATVS